LAKGLGVKQKVTIEGAVVEHGLDPFGQLSYGWIRVTGPFIEDQQLWDDYDDWILKPIFLDFPSEYAHGTSVLIGRLLLGERE
jgi:hypothetical protein